MSDGYIGYRFVLLVVIVAFNAFFAAAELALVSVRRSRLHELAAEGSAGAQAALSLLGRPERLLATIQVGVTLASLIAGWAGEDTVYRVLVAWLAPVMTPGTAAIIGALSFVISFLVLTFVMVVIGEVVPKSLAIQASDRLAVATAPFLLFFYRVAQPFVFVLARSSTAITRLLGKRESQGTVHSPEELKLIASSIRTAGLISRFEEEAMDRLLDLHEVAVREVMVPRNAIVSVPVDSSLDHVLRTLMVHRHARVPVYEQTPEHIIGYLHYKDLLPVWERHRMAVRMHAPVPPFRLRALLRKHAVVPESKPLSQIIDEFRQAHLHMAVVVDEFGTIVGLVTLEDAIEQIVGEIEDEFDVKRPRPALEANVLELEGTIPIRDLEAQYGIELPANAGFETLAGFLLFRFGYIPNPGDSVVAEGHRFVILQMDHNRIARVRIERALEEETEPTRE